VPSRSTSHGAPTRSALLFQPSAVAVSFERAPALPDQRHRLLEGRPAVLPAPPAPRAAVSNVCSHSRCDGNSGFHTWKYVSMGEKPILDGIKAIVNGKKATLNGKKAIVNGKRTTGNGKRATVNGEKATLNGASSKGDKGYAMSSRANDNPTPAAPALALCSPRTRFARSDNRLPALVMDFFDSGRCTQKARDHHRGLPPLEQRGVFDVRAERVLRDVVKELPQHERIRGGPEDVPARVLDIVDLSLELTQECRRDIVNVPRRNSHLRGPRFFRWHGRWRMIRQASIAAPVISSALSPVAGMRTTLAGTFVLSL